jgi:hypothetical protein
MVVQPACDAQGWLERVLVPYETFELRRGFNPILGRLGNIRLSGVSRHMVRHGGGSGM